MHRLNMELDLLSLFGLHVQRCTYPLAEAPQRPPPPHLGSYTRTLVVSQDRLLLFVTSWCGGEEEYNHVAKKH